MQNVEIMRILDRVYYNEMAEFVQVMRQVMTKISGLGIISWAKIMASGSIPKTEVLYGIFTASGRDFGPSSFFHRKNSVIQTLK